ncbi:MAG: hypothetical protein AAGA27_01715 [Pseudomonadota bacterium]
MIIHISIPADNPAHVAEVLAELVQGTCKPLNWCPGGYMVFTDDNYSTGIEILPNNIVFMPGATANQTLRIIRSEQQTTQYSGIHFLLTINSSYEKIFAIAKRVGWQAVRKRSLGVVEMVEFWIENKTMVEIVLATEERKTIKALSSEAYQGC